jgi:serine/threonine protein kinase
MCVEDFKLVCKLGDFGFASSCYRDSQLILFNGCKGTRRGYMAPEIYATLKNPESYYDARKSDVFALGVILFAMVMGRLPF